MEDSDSLQLRFWSHIHFNWIIYHLPCQSECALNLYFIIQEYSGDTYYINTCDNMI